MHISSTKNYEITLHVLLYLIIYLNLNLYKDIISSGINYNIILLGTNIYLIFFNCYSIL